jgi:Bacterial Ig-like domain (group 2)
MEILAKLNQSCDNSAAETGLTSRVEMNHTETRSSLAARIRLVLSAGVALLLCVSWGCSGFFINPSLSSIYITPASATIAVTNTVQLTATGIYSDGSQNKIQGSSVGWSSSATNTATVTSPGGLVTGVATGTATITASAQGVTSTASVTVTPSNITTLSITTTPGSTSGQSAATISGTGSTATLQFYAYGNGLSSNDLTNAVTWTSSNPSVATISTGNNSGGLAMGVSPSPPTTNITATITNTSSGQQVTSNTIVVTVQ